MNLKTIHYKNNLLYVAAIENNIELVNKLFKSGYPKSIADLPLKLKKTGSKEELNKIVSSYHNATFNLVADLIKNQQYLPMLAHCLYYFVKQDKTQRILADYQTLGGFSFFFGNVKAFELLCAALGKEKLCEQSSLLWYIHQAKRNKGNSKKVREKLCSYVENLGVDWSKADQCLIRWANIHRNIEDFQYFYKKRKQGLSKHSGRDKIIKKELTKCIDGFLLWSVDIENNLQNPVLDHVVKTKEFTNLDPYEGHWIILRKCYRLAKHFSVDCLAMESYFQKLLINNPEIIKSLTKSRVRVPQLNHIIDKFLLKESLSKNLNLSHKTHTIQKI